MPFSIQKVGKENQVYKLNKVGSKIATYRKLALIINIDTWQVVKYGEFEEMDKYISQKYYYHPQYRHRSFRNMVFWSDVWLPEALEKMIENQDTEFTEELDFPGTDHLFVSEGAVCVVYHPFCVTGDPSIEYWKEQEEKLNLLLKKEGKPTSSTSTPTSTPDDEAAEKRRQRSLKAAETLRKKREAAKKENGN